MNHDVNYLFGAFVLETNTQLLSHANKAINLQPKVYRLLLYFLQHPGRLISREELFDAVWKTSFVEDSALRRAINALREVLNDECKSPRYILTVSKRGYRFLPEVTLSNVIQENLGAVQAPVLPSQFYDASVKYDVGLELLFETFQHVVDGNRRLIFLNGAKGIGKTTLLENFLEKISHPELATLHARCVQLAVAVEPFMPLLEALELRCREPQGKPLIDCLHQVAPTWLYQMLNMLEPEEIAALQPKVLRLNTGRMLREGAHFFEEQGKKHIFILILDDSHWVDEFTLDLLNFLVVRSLPTRLLMIISYRSCANTAISRRFEQMREELRHKGLCQEVSLRR